MHAYPVFRSRHTHPEQQVLRNALQRAQSPGPGQRGGGQESCILEVPGLPSFGQSRSVEVGFLYSENIGYVLFAFVEKREVIDRHEYDIVLYFLSSLFFPQSYFLCAADDPHTAKAEKILVYPGGGYSLFEEEGKKTFFSFLSRHINI